MKKIPWLFLVFIILGACINSNVSNNTEKEDCIVNLLHYDELLVSYYTSLHTDSLYGKTLREQNRIPFDILSGIINYALDSSNKVYESSFSPLVTPQKRELTYDAIKAKLGVVEVNEFFINQINEIGFVESWRLTTEPFSLLKKVKQYTLVRRYMRNSVPRNSLLFDVCVNTDTLIDPEWKFIGSFTSKVFVSAKALSGILATNDWEKLEWEKGYSIFNDRNPFWNFYASNKFLEELFNVVKTGCVSITDYESGDSLAFSDVENRMGMVEQTILIEYNDSTTRLEKVKLEADLGEIKEILFTEDWYIDTKTYAIKKEIKALAPVRYYTDTDGVQKQIVVFVAEL